MVRKSLIVGIILWPFAIWAADKIQPLDVKTGLWEVTTTSVTSGMPPIPPEALARLTPEQRARMEESMKSRMGGTPKTRTRKDCVTKEKLDKNYLFSEDRKECTHTVVTTSSSKLEMKMQCQEENMKTDGTLRVEVLSSEQVKGNMKMVANGGGRTMNIDADFNARYLGPVCGDIK